MMDARHLTKALSDPSYVLGLDARRWNALLAMAGAEQLAASLAWRLDGLRIPEAAAAILAEARQAAEVQRGIALGEAAKASRTLTPLGIPAILLGGTAFAAAGLDAARGRQIRDPDILVPFDRLGDAEAALQGLVQQASGLKLNLHHRILPVATEPEPLGNGLWALSHEDMVVHAVAQLFVVGDLSGGLRNLWDIDRLIREFSDEGDFWTRLHAASARQGLTRYLSRALRLSHHLFETPVDPWLAWQARPGDIFYLGRLLARNGRGLEIRKILRLAFRLRARRIAMHPRASSGIGNHLVARDRP